MPNTEEEGQKHTLKLGQKLRKSGKDGNHEK